MKPAPKGKQPAKPAPKAQKSESEEEEEEVKPAPKRKASKDSGKGKKVAQKEEEPEVKGTFEVYVGGLAWSMGDDDVRGLFSPCGEISEVRLLRKDDGKSKGIAFVKFTTEKARKAAIELNGSEQYGRQIKVEESAGKNNNAGGNNKRVGGDFAKPIPDVIESCTVFIGNLPYSATQETLADFFADCGDVKATRIATERETNRVKNKFNLAAWIRLRRILRH